VTGVRAIDRETGEVVEISGRSVINAAGPWIGGLVPGVRNHFPRRWARALNLVLSVPPPKAAIGVPSPFVDPVLGRRMLFLVPDGERTLLGTSYRLDAEDEPALIERHAEEFREEWNRACPQFPIRAEDVTGIHAGRLPLRDGYQRGNPGTLATQGRVLDHRREQAAGLYSIVGTKLTTARLLAERAVDQVAHQLENRQPSRSASTALHAAGAGHPPRLRILVLAPHPFFQARGTPIAVRSVVEFLTRAGHSVDVLAYHEGEAVEIPGCRLFRIPRVPLVSDVRPGFSLKKVFCDSFMLASCLKLARRGRYDLIHAVEESVFMAAIIKKLTGIPFVYDMDSALVDQMVEKHPRFHRVQPMLDRWVGAAIRLSEGIVAVCPALVDVARRHDPSKLVALIEDTTLLDGHYSGAEPIRDPQRDGTLFLYVGNLERYQGIDLLLDAFAQAAGRMVGTLALIGGNPADIARYQEQARQLGITDRVQFLGPRPLEDLGGYLHQADVLVSPRLTGSNTPMKIYSYLDAGVPVLATRLATHTQVLTDQVAMLVEPNPAAMADGMIRLAQGAELRSRLAINARELAQREFTRAAADRKLASFYRQITKQLTAQPSPPRVREVSGAIA
jgi:glycosyltransferase involved in cell wall biosynthesis